MSLYTSLETSIALRDAGAPQQDWSHPHPWAPMYWNSEGEPPWLGGRVGDNISVRAFRADEIIEALPKRIVEIIPFPSGEWCVRIRNKFDDYFGDTFVEALAAAWLVVLREVKP